MMRSGMAEAMPALLLTNSSQLLTVSGPSGPRRGSAMRELSIIKDAAVLCREGKIVAAGPRTEIEAQGRDAEVFDCGGRVVLPGFVDSHTHPVFVAARLVDFEKRIAGVTYEEIAASGGG